MSDFSNNGNLGGFARNQFQLQGEDESTRQQLIAAAQEIGRQRVAARQQLPGVQSAQARAAAAPPVLGPELQARLGGINSNSIASGRGAIGHSSADEGFQEAQRQLIDEQLRTGQGSNIKITTPDGREVTPLDDNFQSTLSALYGDDQGDIDAFQTGIEELNADVTAPGFKELYGRGSPPDTIAASALNDGVNSALDGYYAQAAGQIENEFAARELLLGKFATEGIQDPLNADLGNVLQVNKDYLAARGQDLDLSETDAILEAANQTAATSEDARRNIAQSYATQVGEVLPLIKQDRIDKTDAIFQQARSGDPAALKDAGVPQYVIDQLANEEKDIAEREAALLEQQTFTNQEFRRLRSYAASGNEQDAAVVASIDEILTGRPFDGESAVAASPEERYRDFVSFQQAELGKIVDRSRATPEEKAANDAKRADIEDAMRLVQQILGVDDDGFSNDVSFRPELLDQGALDMLDVLNQAHGVGNTLSRSIGRVAAGAPLTRQGLNPTPPSTEGEE